MALETSDVISLVRGELSDPLVGGSDAASLWSEEELYHYLDEAQREFARETLCLSDATTYTDLPATADSPWVDFDDLIVEVRQAYYGANKRNLSVKTLADMERGVGRDDYGSGSIGSNWQQATGVPTTIITDMEYGRARLYPIPTEDDTVDLMVYREPLEEVEDSGVDLEIPPRFRRALIHSVVSAATGKDDADTHDKELSNVRGILWRNSMAEAKSFFNKKQRRAPTTRYGGI